jgi:hypothetical protein
MIKIIFMLVATHFVHIASIYTNSSAVEKRVIIDITGHPVKGYYNTPVAIIAFSDYLCPVCEGLESVLHKVLENVYVCCKIQSNRSFESFQIGIERKLRKKYNSGRNPCLINPNP